MEIAGTFSLLRLLFALAILLCLSAVLLWLKWLNTRDGTPRAYRLAAIATGASVCMLTTALIWAALLKRWSY